MALFCSPGGVTLGRTGLCHALPWGSGTRKPVSLPHVLPRFLACTLRFLRPPPSFFPLNSFSSKEAFLLFSAFLLASLTMLVQLPQVQPKWAFNCNRLSITPREYLQKPLQNISFTLLAFLSGVLALKHRLPDKQKIRLLSFCFCFTHKCVNSMV